MIYQSKKKDIKFNINQFMSRFNIQEQIFLALLVLSILLPQTQSLIGVDPEFTVPFTTQTFKCLYDNQMRFAIPTGYRQYGKSPGVSDNLNNAKAVGLSTPGILMAHCTSKDPIAQVDEMMANVPTTLYGNTVWIYVGAMTYVACYWDVDPIKNCQYLTDIASRIQTYGKQVGIQTTSFDWARLMGNVYACPGLSKYKLWYTRIDNKTSFSDFTHFGGWTRPDMKRYQTLNLCGFNIFYNYQP